MSDIFSKLPDTHDFTGLARAVIEVVEALRDDKRKIDQIARDVSETVGEEVKAAAVSVFLQRKDQSRINRSNHTLATLFDYIRLKHKTFPAKARAKMTEHWRVIMPREESNLHNAEIENQLGDRLREFNGVSKKDIGRLGDKLVGEFVMIRKSVRHPDMIVKSLLAIRRFDSTQLRVVHTHMDRQDVERVSTGFLIPMVRNVYGILRIEEGEGLEQLVLKEPIQEKFNKMMGFLNSINIDRNILSARVVVVANNDKWAGLGPRFDVDDVKSNLYISQLVSLLNPSCALQLPDDRLENIE